ncbi:hypothetical protein IEQ34_015016 [Dendrobium chrysotoxum]|uniref:Uncharacterized protein n=1 Tax=Dendrobium chrysotoxum TaxID=161865 RepID=A0AAV7G5D9_DENCH|nr:hypothetical protein IEQ34_015016 [Dendrobium chrysotoxum]
MIGRRDESNQNHGGGQNFFHGRTSCGFTRDDEEDVKISQSIDDFHGERSRRTIYKFYEEKVEIVEGERRRSHMEPFQREDRGDRLGERYGYGGQEQQGADWERRERNYGRRGVDFEGRRGEFEGGYGFMYDVLRYPTLYEMTLSCLWLMERGLLSLEEAQKVYAKKLRKNHNQKFGLPAKVTTPVKKSSTVLVKKEVKVTSKASVKTTKKKVIDSEDDDDDDFVLNKLGNKIKVSS